MRAELSVDVYMDYRDKILAGVEFPPLDVFFDGSEYWLADGFHRFYGHREAKKASVKCNVHNGTVRDAILFAVGANDEHGLKRTPQDKRNAVQALLDDTEWGKRSSNWVADKCKVSHTMVEKFRKELATLQVEDAKAEPVARVGRDGKARKAPKPSTKTKSQASVTGGDVNHSAAPPESLPSVGTVNRTEPGEQGAGDAGECPHGGPHDFLEGACVKCCEPDAAAPVEKMGQTDFNTAILDKQNEQAESVKEMFKTLLEHIRQTTLLLDRINNATGRKFSQVNQSCHDTLEILSVDIHGWKKKVCK